MRSDSSIYNFNYYHYLKPENKNSELCSIYIDTRYFKITYLDQIFMHAFSLSLSFSLTLSLFPTLFQAFLDLWDLEVIYTFRDEAEEMASMLGQCLSLILVSHCYSSLNSYRNKRCFICVSNFLHCFPSVSSWRIHKTGTDIPLENFEKKKETKSSFFLIKKFAI